MQLINADALLDALDTVTWYNDLAEIVSHWKDEGYFEEYENHSLSWNWETFHSYDTYVQNQLQVIWIICVELFGDYGTSPRSGWIKAENKDAFYHFVDAITETYRDDNEEDSKQE